MIHLTQAIVFFRESEQLLKKAVDFELDSPNIIIEPAHNLVQKAVDLLKKTDPKYFVGVRKIIIGPESAYGHVESGPGKDPAVIHLNLNRIENEIRAQMNSNPTSTEQAIIQTLAETISHERGHVKSFDPRLGFQGGEVPAEAEAKRMSNLLSEASVDNEEELSAQVDQHKFQIVKVRAKVPGAHYYPYGEKGWMTGNWKWDVSSPEVKRIGHPIFLVEFCFDWSMPNVVVPEKPGNTWLPLNIIDFLPSEKPIDSPTISSQVPDENIFNALNTPLQQLNGHGSIEIWVRDSKTGEMKPRYKTSDPAKAERAITYIQDVHGLSAEIRIKAP